MKFKGITIGIPKEITLGERRVAAIPDTVSEMKEAGARVLVESGAGEGAFISDEDYRRHGAEVVKGPQELYGKATVVIKVKEPRFNETLGKSEAEMMRKGSYMLSFLHPANPINHETVRKLAENGVICYTLDGIPRISRAQQMDALTSMSTVAGYKAAIIAASHLVRFIPMMPTAFGVIQPANFLVVGTGVAGLQAIGTARRIGARVRALDIREEAQEQAKSLGAEIIPLNIPQELALEEGGYARRLPEEWYQKEREVLEPFVADSDVVILTALIPGERAPMLVKSSAVEQMKKGSVIVDIAVDQGGNCELTRFGEEYSFRGVTISGLVNIPATLAVDATRMFSKNVWQFLKYLAREGFLSTDANDEIIGQTLVTLEGRIVHRGTLLAMGEEGGSE